MALILEGFMSGFYHICPTNANFQFGKCLYMFIYVYVCTTITPSFSFSSLLSPFSSLLPISPSPSPSPFLLPSLLAISPSPLPLPSPLSSPLSSSLPPPLLAYCSTDTAFMFIIGGLFLVKIFQKRHPDINANAFVAFFAFAIIIFITLIGLVSGTTCSR